MSQQGEPKDQFAHIPQVWADREFPVVYADIALSAQNLAGAMKVTFGRLEPELFGRAMDLQKATVTPILQLVIPTAGFAATAAFFEGELNKLIHQGAVPAKLVEDMRKATADTVQLANAAFDNAQKQKQNG